MHYQPTISLEDGATTGYEALLRWEHPTRGLVPPAEFIPLAEEGRQIVEIGRWVLRQATGQAAAWSMQSGRPIGVAVNLSPRQLAHDDVVHAAVLGSLSCSHAQGYLFGHPLPAADQQPAPAANPAPESGSRV